MLTHAGKEAHKIYKIFYWAEKGDAMKFDKVIEALKEYRMPRRNIFYECHKFWSLKQEEGETVQLRQKWSETNLYLAEWW